MSGLVPLHVLAARRSPVQVVRADRPTVTGRLLYWPRDGAVQSQSKAKVELQSGKVIAVDPTTVYPLPEHDGVF